MSLSFDYRAIDELAKNKFAVMGSVILALDHPNTICPNIWGTIDFHHLGKPVVCSSNVYSAMQKRDMWDDLSGHLLIEVTGWKGCFGDWVGAYVMFEPKLYIEHEADAVIIQQLMKMMRWDAQSASNLGKILSFGFRNNPSDAVMASVVDGYISNS